MGVGTLAFLLIFIQKVSIGRLDLVFPSIPVAFQIYFEELVTFKEEQSKRNDLDPI